MGYGLREIPDEEIEGICWTCFNPPMGYVYGLLETLEILKELASKDSNVKFQSPYGVWSTRKAYRRSKKTVGFNPPMGYGLLGYSQMISLSTCTVSIPLWGMVYLDHFW